MAESALLPLLTRATVDGGTYLLVPKARRPGVGASAPMVTRAAAGSLAGRMPDRRPGEGEQYRFHFDMGACIGCKCCVVACNEQNGNPAAINWRKVGDIEGGFYPNVVQSHLSMSCNHCLEPTCLEGCPVDAYSKDALTGIVRHSADTCIGCQYCTWNCSYGAPQFNPERGVVGKCDMCHGRLALGQAPACVSACPQGAIQIEIVSVADWRDSIVAASTSPSASGGAPTGDHSLSTTRVSVPNALPPNARPIDITHVKPEHPHWPLVVMTVLTQLSVGALAAVWLLQLLGLPTRLGAASVSSFIVGALALSASTLHLGRPIHAIRALRMWRRSWLSREALLFTIFSGVAMAYAAMVWFGVPGSASVGGITAAAGAAGVFASACIYRVPARPAWNTRHTIAHFALTAFILGPLFAAAAGAGERRWLGLAAACAAGTQLAVFAAHFLKCIRSDNLALKGTARLLSSVLGGWLLLRGGLLVLGAIVLPLVAAGLLSGGFRVTRDATVGYGTVLSIVALLVAAGSELLGRYLFFVSVVPQHQAAPYIAVESEAA